MREVVSIGPFSESESEEVVTAVSHASSSFDVLDLIYGSLYGFMLVMNDKLFALGRALDFEHVNIGKAPLLSWGMCMEEILESMSCIFQNERCK